MSYTTTITVMVQKAGVEECTKEEVVLTMTDLNADAWKEVTRGAADLYTRASNYWVGVDQTIDVMTGVK